MNDQQGIGPAAGFVLFLLGTWLVIRTVAGKPSLADVILGLGGPSSASSSGGRGGSGTSLTGGLPTAVEHGNTGNIIKDLTIGAPNEPLTPAWIYKNTLGQIFG